MLVVVVKRLGYKVG